MKKILFTMMVVGAFLLSQQNVSAQYAQTYGQCNRATSTPIQCGYYEEGYQDGVSDAQNNRNNDYKRYRNKLEGNRYESNYQQGYDAGYASIRPYQRWDKAQRDSYDDGFQDGENDKRRNISRLAERYEGQYNRTYEAFYKQGYYDGYDGKARQYDLPIGGAANPVYPNPTNPTYPTNPVFPPVGTATGSVSWSGRVDDRTNIIIQGSEVKLQVVSGGGGFVPIQSMNGVLPRRPATVSVNKTNGRGDVFVTQQPSRANGYTAIVQIADRNRGADDYRVDISWQSTAPVEEPYQAGRAIWRGKVDQTANLVISGQSLQILDASGTGVSTLQSNVTGYLALRPGTVNVRKVKGRGTVNVIQQPSAENDYVAIVQIVDPDRSTGDYEVEITW